MRSRQLALERYDTDKIPNGYLERYDPVLLPWVDKGIKLLEIGIHEGASLLLWRDYFPSGIVVGIDSDPPPKALESEERIHMFQGRQEDSRFLSQVARRMAPEGFDIVIDDASHIGELTRKAFWHLFDNHLKPGGLYVIEDWGTGYWDDWPDGRAVGHTEPFLAAVSSWLVSLRRGRGKVPVPCHSYGMVGFIKELVDEQCAADVSRTSVRRSPTRQSRFESLLVTPSIVFVRKASHRGGRDVGQEGTI